MQKAFRLDNGVRVYLWPWETTSAAISITLDTGSRYDPCVHVSEREPPMVLEGLNHLFEHVIARSTRRWSSWQSLTEFGDSTCSAYNAETDQTTVSVYAATDRQRVITTLEYLADMVLHPIISRENVQHERERATEEYYEYNDVPSERAALLFDRHMFGTDGLAHPILGSDKSIARISVEALRNFHRRVVCGERVIIAVTGNFHPERAERAIRKMFGRLRRGSPKENLQLNYRQLGNGIHLAPAQTQQVYCMLGWPLFGINDPRRFAMTILRSHLSDGERGSSLVKIGASSLGKGYSAIDGLNLWADIGQWHVALPVSPDKFLEALAVVSRAIDQVISRPLTSHEHQLAIRNITINAKARFGDPLRAALSISNLTANAGSFLPLRTYLTRVRSTSRPQILRVARQIFVHSRLLMVAHGPVWGRTKQSIRNVLWT